MIIRIFHNCSFTQIGNASINDERLSLEALGLLVYLLSKPHDWQVRVDQLQARARAGRDKMRRIVGELIEAGYILRSKVRDPQTGEFVRDEFVVSEEPTALPGAGEPAPDLPAPDLPAPDLPAPDLPAPEKASLAYKEDYKHGQITNTDSDQDLRESAGAGAGKGKNAETRLPTADCRLPKAPEPKPEDDPEFQALLAGFPGIDVPSRAFRAWSGLTVAERKRAIERVPSYLAELKALRRASPHKLSTYLAEKLFDQAADPKAEPPARTMIAPRTQLWWTLFWLRKQRGEKVSFMLDMAKQNTGCAVALRDVPDAAAEALLVKVERISADYRAIETMLRRDGLSLNDFAAGQWIWAPPSPSFAPPASPAARADDLEDML